MRFLLTCFALLLTLCSLSPEAEAQGFIVDVPGGNDLPLALPKTIAPHGDPENTASTIWETIQRDLELSGYFDLIDPLAYIEQGKGVEPGQFKFDDWRDIKAHILVKTRFIMPGSPDCDAQGTQICADVYVYYVISGEKLMSKRFKTSAKNARGAAHEIANAVLISVTGQPGFFGGHIAAVGSQAGNKEVFVMGSDGSEIQRVTRNGSINLSPAWAPAGDRIAWTSYKRGNPDLYMKNLRTGRTRVLSNQRGINVSPDFSPNGRQVALARSENGDTDLFLIDTSTGKEIKRLTRGGGIDVAPNFSPDGSKIAYASERSGGSQIYILDLDGGESTRISFEGGFNTDPVFSSDGSKIAFVGRSQSGFDIFVAELKSGNLHRITQDMGDNEDPTWSPDGRYLLFSSNRTGVSQIWLSTGDGRHQMAITRSGGWTQPTWMPEGD
jgi:TolB protein